MQLLLLFLTCFVSLSSALGEIPKITIGKITRILKSGSDPHFEIEVTDGAETFDRYHLNILTSDGANQYQDYSVEAIPTKATFAGDLAVIVEKTDAQFILTQREKTTDNPLTHGELKLNLPELFPSPCDSHWVGVNDDYSLRISVNTAVENWKLDNKECTETGGGSICYFVDVAKTQKVEFCSTDTPQVCDKTFTPDTSVVGTEVPSTETELKYAEDGKSAHVTVAHPAKANGGTEVLVYKDGDTSFVKACSSTPCDIGQITLGDEFIVVTVGFDGSTPADTSQQILTDYEVVGTPLSTTLIETRWTHQDSKNMYHVSTTSSAAFTDTTVTCEPTGNPDDYHCFGYFTGLDQDTAYPLTVQTTDGDGTNPNKKNKITLTGTKTEKDPPGMAMNISSLDTKWHKGLRSFEINTCVQQAEASDPSTYEAILINKRGQWEKVKGVTHQLGDELCFDALHVNMYNFDLSEDLTLVVVKRGSDGITVIESSNTNIYVGANLMTA